MPHIAKYVLRRSSLKEKYCGIVKHRTGHYCNNQWMVIGIIAWEGVSKEVADKTYETMKTTLLTRRPEHGYYPDQR